MGTPYNCTVSRISKGQYTITFTNAPSDFQYLAFASAYDSGSTFIGPLINSKSTSTYTLIMRDGGGSLNDPDSWCDTYTIPNPT